MRISVLGLGYVGAVSSACLANRGHQVYGVDINPEKVRIINEGRSPVVEKEIDQVIADVVASGNLVATTDMKEALSNTDIYFICVGTPSQENGSIDLSYIHRVMEEIGCYLRDTDSYKTVVVRSTIIPGTTMEHIVPSLESVSGKKAGEAFGVCFNPEFLREGTSVYDFNNPPMTVIGEYDERSGSALEGVYAELDAPLFRTSIPVAESIKYACNTYHALKIAFANEVGNFCKLKGIDSHEVMRIFCEDRKLNVSTAYLKPGFAFGGSCLPKDIRAMLYEARKNDLEMPVLRAALESNDFQIEKGIRMVMNKGKKRIGLFGLGFKEGTDDLRESPMVRLVEQLIGKGYKILIYDKNVSIARLSGANKRYIEKEIPHISELMCPSMEEVIDSSDVLVMGTKEEEFERIPALMGPEKEIIDLVRIDNLAAEGIKYEGICW